MAKHAMLALDCVFRYSRMALCYVKVLAGNGLLPSDDGYQTTRRRGRTSSCFPLVPTQTAPLGRPCRIHKQTPYTRQQF